jgi:hypothetical protein
MKHKRNERFKVVVFAVTTIVVKTYVIISLISQGTTFDESSLPNS